MNTGNPTIERQQWRQLALITTGAIALYAGLRVLPTGTNLSHMDFRVDPKAGNAIEFCDPANPQFIPVVEARSPVAMSVASAGPAAAGREVRATVTLQTGSGKPVAPEDLLVTHTKQLHLLIVDPTLTDYQHVHPAPTREKGAWTFAFIPKQSGTYRVFGDFTPAATARGLYASADFVVSGGDPERRVPQITADQPPTAASGSRVERGGYHFSLETVKPARAGEVIDLRFAVARADAGVVPLQPVMGAFAHLVAFDAARSGFAHLHPVEADLAVVPDAKAPRLNFKLTIPRAGRYVVWAQVNVGGEEMFVPFELPVRQ